MEMQKCLGVGILFISLIKLINGSNVEKYGVTGLGSVECSLSASLEKIFKTIWPPSPNTTLNAYIKLELYTRHSNRTIISINGHMINIIDSDFRPERKTVVITHGFREDSTTDWMPLLIDAYLKYEDVNIIALDWSIFTVTVDYYGSTKAVLECAQQAVNLLEEIVYQFKNPTSFSPIHLIGFSLGAQVMGNIARRFNENQNIWNIERITGLDPADPCFGDRSGSSVRLSSNDAPFVDIIHTNGNTQNEIVFGMRMPIGHVDFYVNGGQIQPGCPGKGAWYREIVDDKSGFYTALCSHRKATHYFIESLELINAGDRTPMLGMKWNYDELFSALDFLYNNTCRSQCVPMGINAHNYNEESFGTYFVPTAYEKPFNVIRPSDKVEIEKTLRETMEPRNQSTAANVLDFLQTS